MSLLPDLKAAHVFQSTLSMRRATPLDAYGAAQA